MRAPDRSLFSGGRAFAIFWLLTLLIAAPPLAHGDELTDLRRSQDAELIDLHQTYDELAKEYVPRLPDGRLDTDSLEYQAVLKSYSRSRTEVTAKYKQLDGQTRGAELKQTLDAYEGRIVNTGGKTGDPYGLPKNIKGDIDLSANDLEAAKSVTTQWVQRQPAQPIEIYTLDNPRQPVLVSPENLDEVQWDRVVMARNPNTDTTLWTPQTEEIRRAKVEIADAWSSPGGLKGTGNEAMPRDKRGFVLDNEGKLLHSDRPVGPVTGAHDEDLKTFAKSVSKGGQATGRTGEATELYEQAQKLQNYGDPYEAGIATLGEDTPAQAAQKVEDWKVQARQEFDEVKKSGQRLGDAADTAREDLARQTREAAERQRAAGRPNAEQMEETAQAIEDRRQLAADGNRDVAEENRRLRAEADEAYGGRRAGASASELGDAGDVTPTGSRTRGAADAVDADELVADVARIDPDAKVTPIDGRNPKPGIDVLGAAEAGLDVGGQLFERTSRQMGQAVDEDRDLNAGDAAAIASDMVPGVAAYRATSEALEDRQVERLRRQERIAQLSDKPERSLEEALELTRLQHAEKYNPDTAAGNVMAMAKEGIAGYFQEMEEGARQAGRESPEFLRDGVPMLGRMARDAANAVNPINQLGLPIFEGDAELSTLDERADWAGQKTEMVAFVNRRATAADKRTQAMVAELDRMLLNEDMSLEANRQRAAALLAGIEANQAEIDKLVAMADKHLGEVDPEELSYLRNVSRSQPSVDALRDYADQMQASAGGWGEAKGGFTAEHGAEAEWGDGGFEDEPSTSDLAIGRIVELGNRCEYRNAQRLAQQLMADDPGNAWIEANYPAISEWAGREQAYHQSLGLAHRALQAGSLTDAIGALEQAMTNASAQCQQDRIVQQLLDRAVALADRDRYAAIDRARQDGRSAAMAASAPSSTGGTGDYGGLVNSLIDLMGRVNRADSGTSSGNAGIDLDSLYGNTERWDEAAARAKSGDPSAYLPKGYQPRPSAPPAPQVQPGSPASDSSGPAQGEFSVDPDARNAPPPRQPQLIGPCHLGPAGGCLYEDGWHDSQGRVFRTAEEMRRANGG